MRPRVDADAPPISAPASSFACGPLVTRDALAPGVLTKPGAVLVRDAGPVLRCVAVRPRAAERPVYHISNRRIMKRLRRINQINASAVLPQTELAPVQRVLRVEVARVGERPDALYE